MSISGLPDRLIDHVEVDVSGLDIGDSIHIGEIQLPEGIAANQDEDLTVAVVAAPSVTPEEAPEEEEQVEEEGVEEEKESAEADSVQEE